MNYPSSSSAAAIDANMQAFRYADKIHNTSYTNCFMVSCSTMRLNHSIRFQ